NIFEIVVFGILNPVSYKDDIAARKVCVLVVSLHEEIFAVLVRLAVYCKALYLIGRFHQLERLKIASVYRRQQTVRLKLFCDIVCRFLASRLPRTASFELLRR